MKQFIDYYAVLGISQQATPKEIKTAFIKQSLRWHPDRSGRDTNRTMQGINEANRILSNTSLREKYNREYQQSKNIPTKQDGCKKPPAANAKQKINYSCELKTDYELIFICTNAAKYKLEYIHVVLLELNKRNYSSEKIKELVKRKYQSNIKVSPTSYWINKCHNEYSRIFKVAESWKRLIKLWCSRYRSETQRFLRSLLQ